MFKKETKEMKNMEPQINDWTVSHINLVAIKVNVKNIEM